MLSIMKQVTKIRLFLLVGFVLLPILIVAGLMSCTYLRIQSLPVVVDPRAFAADFDNKDKTPVKLEVDSVGFFPPRGIKRSPYFPYRKLEIISITPSEVCQTVITPKQKITSGERRYIEIDRLWGTFWVEIAKCGSRSEDYGPYRLHVRFHNLDFS